MRIIALAERIPHVNRKVETIMWIDKLALTLLIIGGINWGLVGIFSFDLVAWMFGGQGALISRIVYILVALSAAWCISLLFRDTSEPERA